MLDGFPYSTFGSFAALCQDFQDLPDRDVLFCLMPAVIIRGKGDGGITDLCFTGQFGLRDVGHPDDVDAPGAIKSRFGACRKLGSFNAEVGAPLLHRRPDIRPRLKQDLAEVRTNRIREADMTDNAITEKGAFDAPRYDR